MTATTAHPRTSEHLLAIAEHWGQDGPHPLEAARLEAESARARARAESVREQDLLEATSDWRTEIEAEVGAEFTDADWLEFVADEQVAAAEQAVEDALWRAGCGNGRLR